MPEKKTIQRSRPLIAVIGAAKPGPDYTRKKGVAIGYKLREFLGGDRDGTIFTGGVEGVGVDVYEGVLTYCVDIVRKRPGLLPYDRFFVLVPEDFGVPDFYTRLAALSKTGKLDVIRAGEDMAERRRNLAQEADIVIAVNGHGGSFDEAFIALESGKPLIALSDAGGVSLALSEIKNEPEDVVVEIHGEKFLFDRTKKERITVSDTDGFTGALRSVYGLR